MSRPIITFLLIFGFAFPIAAARADIYGYTDEAGTLVLSDVKTDNRYGLLLKTEIQKQPALRTSVSGARINWENQKLFLPLVAEAARAYQIDEALLHALISTESGYEARAVSPKGAIGLMQVMPATGKRYGATDLKDPAVNIRAGARYLRDLLAMFNQDMKLALAAYNAGENAVLRHGHKIPPYRETIQYVPRVLALYERFRNKT
jgi:soluble lytic murein transglycosylase-like protein